MTTPRDHLTSLYELMGERVLAMLDADQEHILDLALQSSSHINPPEFDALVKLMRSVYLECMLTATAARLLAECGHAETIKVLERCIHTTTKVANANGVHVEPVAANAPRPDSPWSEPR